MQSYKNCYYSTIGSELKQNSCNLQSHPLNAPMRLTLMEFFVTTILSIFFCSLVPFWNSNFKSISIFCICFHSILHWALSTLVIEHWIGIWYMLEHVRSLYVNQLSIIERIDFNRWLLFSAHFRNWFLL